ncbi:hypothetical protein N7533_007556 [Penicillium manginii]|jgi:hypothetical protein|uniref:uncharacterized protein n=1 Tax=Penicillium manginii TaxID=203109 RepID=UPI002547CF56|nr:uncharacterized protein N7533_007556 [Penicillium manginii]KAJ5750528.1 hypothetical protein N7533_007556 [Penicillium manginii]
MRHFWEAIRDSIKKVLTELSLPMVAAEILKDKINLLHRETGFQEEILALYELASAYPRSENISIEPLPSYCAEDQQHKPSSLVALASSSLSSPIIVVNTPPATQQLRAPAKTSRATLRVPRTPTR